MAHSSGSQVIGIKVSTQKTREMGMVRCIGSTVVSTKASG